MNNFAYWWLGGERFKLLGEPGIQIVDFFGNVLLRFLNRLTVADGAFVHTLSHIVNMPHGSEIVLSRLLMLESIVALTSLPTRSTSSTVVRHTRHYIIRKCRGCKLDILKYLLETWTVTLAHLIGKRAVFLTVCVKPLLDKFLKLLVLYSAGLYLHQKSL